MSKVQALLKKIYADEDNIPASEIKYPEPIATPSPSLNWALSGGIYPGGFYCLEGPESSGKTYYAVACLADMLLKNKNGVAFVFDAEGTINDHFIKILLPNKEDQERLIIRRKIQMTGSAIFDYFKDTVAGMMQDGLEVVGCLVDSVNAIIAPKEQNLKSSEDHLIGDLASYLPKALKMIIGLSKPRLKEGFKGVPWFFIMQARDNLDPNAQYTDKYRISGGRAFKHHVDVEVFFEKIEAKKTKMYNDKVLNMNETPIQIGHRVRARIKKNKLGPPARIAEFDFRYDKGIINQDYEMAKLAFCLGLLVKDGNTYYYNEKKIGVGAENTIKAIVDDPVLYDSLETAIKATYCKEEVNNA